MQCYLCTSTDAFFAIFHHTLMTSILWKPAVAPPVCYHPTIDSATHGSSRHSSVSVLSAHPKM